jgi:hypothetical protein
LEDQRERHEAKSLIDGWKSVRKWMTPGRRKISVSKKKRMTDVETLKAIRVLEYTAKLLEKVL